MSSQAPAVAARMVFRKTNQHVGRHFSVATDNSTNRHLSYGRIILNESTPSVSFENGNHETGLICLSGSAQVKVGDTGFSFGQYDSIYIPRDSKVEVRTSSTVDFAEF